MRSCNCWVRYQPEEFQWSTRLGAHNPQCPSYRPTLDPVKNIADAELRYEYEIVNRRET